MKTHADPAEREQEAFELALVAASGVLDADWYRGQYQDVAECDVDPLRHYLRFGWLESRDPGPLFSTRDYLQANPDVAAAGVNPLVHYLGTGWREGRSPRAGFEIPTVAILLPDICPLVLLAAGCAVVA
jgi:hypothetical protein